MTVPSNLVPTSITQLPVAPNPTSSATMVCVIGGITYQVPFIDLQSTVSVPASRRIDTGDGLQGGGDLSADRTLSIATGGVTSDKLADSGVVANTYGSGTMIPVLTVDAKGLVTSATETALVISGYVPDTRQIIAGSGLTGGGNLQADRTLAVNFSANPPEALGAASAGSATAVSRGDHVHPALDFANLTEYTGLLPLTRGGTGMQVNGLTAGAVWYTDGNNGFLQTVQGSSGQVLVSNGSSAPSWSSAFGSGTVTSVNASGGDTGLSFSGGPITSSGTLVLAGTPTKATNLAGGATNKIPYQTALNTTGFIDAPTTANTLLKFNGTGFEWGAVVGAGTVTSVAATVPSFLSVTGSPITTSGTLAISYSGTALPLANGGTAATTAAGARTSILPAYAGNAGKVLAVNVGATDVEYISVGGTGTVTSVDVSGGTTGLTTSGGPITASGSITLAGTLNIANGGTGQTTANGAFNALAPSQSSNAGKYLTTDGTNTSWATVSGGSINPITINSTTVTTAITIAIGQNGFSVGPMTVDTGGSVTVASGQQWVIY